LFVYSFIADTKLLSYEGLGGYRATKNPRVSDDAKQSAEERLAQMSERMNEPGQPDE
jgi:hypothetical protein